MAKIITKSLLLFCFSILLLIFPSKCAYLAFRCDEGNYTAESNFGSNLDSIISSLASAVTTNGFFNLSIGEDPDNVNALVLCTGDVDAATCRQCVYDTFDNAKLVCPNMKRATVWYDECMLRYSNYNMLGNVDVAGSYLDLIKYSGNASELYKAMRPLMDKLKTETSKGDSQRKYATGDIVGPDFMTIYVLMQCTPELLQEQCYACLEMATNQIPVFDCIDLRILFPSCTVRYWSTRFYKLSPPPPMNASSRAPSLRSPPVSQRSPTPPVSLRSPTPPEKNIKTKIIIIVVAITIGVVILFLVIVCVLVKRKRIQEGPPTGANSVNENGEINEISTAKSLQHSFGVIREATDNFSENNKLGEGGFGVVYKGKLENGKEIAVKRLSRESGQGEHEFINEVLLLARLQHRNLVRLLGFSLSGLERLLIYEFVENGSLDTFIFHPVKSVTLNWERRYNIIAGIARGLLYLHEDSRLKIIHRDLKASNVLLDADMAPKIADFGTARLFTPEETQANTFRIVGTYGYMAPEYALYGQFSVKSDVFSFGVLVLEIVTGRKNHSLQDGLVIVDLLSHAWKCWRNGTASSLIDSALKDGSSSIRDMIRCIHIGLLCVQEFAADRPTMASVVLMLASSSITLTAPSEPAFVSHASVNTSSLKPLNKD